MKNIYWNNSPETCTLSAEVEIPYRLYKDINHIDKTIKYELAQQFVEKILEEDLIDIKVDCNEADPLGPGMMKCYAKLTIIQN